MILCTLWVVCQKMLTENLYRPLSFLYKEVGGEVNDFWAVYFFFHTQINAGIQNKPGINLSGIMSDKAYFQIDFD